MLPNILGTLKQTTGSFGPGLVVLSFALFAGAGALLYLGPVWRRQWSVDSAMRAGLLKEQLVPERNEA